MSSTILMLILEPFASSSACRSSAQSLESQLIIPEEIGLGTAHCACTVTLVLVEGVAALIKRINLEARQSVDEAELR